MPPRVPPEPQAQLSQELAIPRIVLAIDYGTTFTGLAWMQTTGDSVPEFSDLNLFRQWPDRNEVKVPSEVSYSLTSGNDDGHVYRQWGYSIDVRSKVLRWTKLELVRNRSPLEELEILRELMDGLSEINELHDDVNEITHVPRHLSKTTEDIIEFYLGHVAREWSSHITAQGMYILNRVPVDIVVTHPAMWPSDAKNTLVRAVCGAFNRHVLPQRRHIHVISEPEACALYVIQDVLRQRSRPMQAGDCFTLCDAGGGTIDLASYHLESIDPLKLIRIGNVSGAQVGATTVDRAFLAWIETKLGGLDIRPAEYGKGGHYILMPMANVLLGKFEAFKCNFTGSESYDLTVPRGAVILSNEEDQQIRQLHISSDTMKDLFRESIDGLNKLVRQQITYVNEERIGERRCEVSSIFLAGGFAANDYLYNEVTRFARRYGYVNVYRANDSWSSVVQGAVLRGMAIGARIPPKVATCPRRYGLCLNQGRMPDITEGIWDIDPPDENVFPQGRLIWLVSRQDVIFPDSEFKKKIKFSFETEQCGRASVITFVADGGDRIPSRLEDLSPGGKCVVLGYWWT